MNIQTKVYFPDDEFHFSFVVDNVFYVREWGKGLLKLENNELSFIENSEIFAEEIKLAQVALQEMTGEIDSDDLLGKIFSEFCIGK